ncbi:hypothetical protein J0801_29555 [Bacillus cereus]|uniref:hypothetical protein n=1 Tax=Bacillus cereus TaxID=1396 RepID=UPI002DB69544|nr:hypothetical protein [Bacillus cereus]
MYYYEYDLIRPTGSISQHYVPEKKILDLLNNCKGQYVRTSISGIGIVAARLLGYDSSTGMVELDIAYPWDIAGYTEVNLIDLVTITCIGWELPPQYQQHQYQQHHHGSTHGRQWIWTNQYGWIQVPY